MNTDFFSETLSTCGATLYTICIYMYINIVLFSRHRTNWKLVYNAVLYSISLYIVLYTDCTVTYCRIMYCTVMYCNVL